MYTILLVGHRCSGKTSISDALAYRGYACFDLDREIETLTSSSPEEIIASDEGHFRELEVQTLNALHSQATLDEDSRPRIISVGAGCLSFPEDAIIIWISRKNWSNIAAQERERLKIEMSFEEEIAWMCATREPVWKRRAHLKIDVPSGRSFDRIVEKVAVSIEQLLRVSQSEFAKKTWIVASQRDLERAINDVNIFDFAGIECRSDLVQSPPNIKKMIASLRHFDPDWLSARSNAMVFDIDIKYIGDVLSRNILGDLEPRQLILSVHPDRVDPIDLEQLIAAGRALQERHPNWTNIVFKYAPLVESFDQLGFAKALVHPLAKAGLQITFLAQGKTFRFYRILNLTTNITNYIPARINEGNDPSFLGYDLQDWLDHIDVNEASNFQALIGEDIERSQGSFWHGQQSRKAKLSDSYLKIPMRASELESGLAQCVNIGIHQLSVTSPLKKNFAMPEKKGIPRSYALEILDTPDQAIRMANTLQYDGEKWLGLDTDVEGMLAQLNELKLEKGSVALFGKGDVSRAIRAAIDQTQWKLVYHTGSREGWLDIPAKVDLVVNASGREAFEGAPKCTFWVDLHYRNTLEHTEAIYSNGDLFFEAQGRAQRKFWKLEGA